MRHSNRGRPRRTWLWWAAGSVVLIALGLVLLVAGARGRDVGPQLPGPIGRTGVSTSLAHPQALEAGAGFVRLAAMTSTMPETAPAVATAHVRATKRPRPAPAAFLVRSRPVHLWIPRLGISTSIVELGLNPDGSVQVPSNTVQVGWYVHGPAPGQRGSSVILGHVDSYRGVGVFFYLDMLRPGNLVIVRLANGQVVQFAVIGLREYTKAQFPERVVYGPRSYSALQLVTCGGVFDHQTGHYLSNIVVYTKRVIPHR